MIITTRANVPDDLAKAWLQHLRNFDTANPGCHFEVIADARNTSLDDIMRVIEISPPLPVTVRVK